MSKYTAEQVERYAWYAAEHSQVVAAMLRDYAALLRERKSAKAGVTDKMVRVAADQIWLGTDVAKNAPRMRRALEAVAPMLVSAKRHVPMQGQGYRPGIGEPHDFLDTLSGIVCYGVSVAALVAIAWPLIAWAVSRV